jgi:hypothetical protein
MKPLTKGQETGLVEIPASWYIDDLPPMMFIKKAAVSGVFSSSNIAADRRMRAELTWMGKPKRCHGYLERPF